MSEHANLRSVLEAMIFSSDRPLPPEQLRKVLDTIETTEIRKAIEELKREYEIAGRGIRIVEVAGGFQMVTAPDYASFLKKLYRQRRLERLSKPGLETLAIIAYKQPITKTEIEELRSVNVDGVIQHLLGKGLVSIVGRKQAQGRPYVFGTTRYFLEYFGLKSLDELPKMEDFSKLASGEDSHECIDASKKN